LKALLEDHFPLLVVQAALISWFLALLWYERERRAAFFWKLFLSLVGGSIAIAWLLSWSGGAAS
jgi:hypothetical protein